jgi:hypothetical protein
MKNITRDIIRWVIFIPLFLIGYWIAWRMAKSTIKWLFKHIFPIEGVLEYFLAGFGVFAVVFVVLFYLGTLAALLEVCPNRKAGARIMLIIFFGAIGMFLLDGYSLIQSKTSLTLHVVTFLVLIVRSFQENELSPQEVINDNF